MEAAADFQRAIALHRAAGGPVLALLSEVASWQALTYAGRSVEAAAALPDMVRRTRESGNPSAQSWARYVAGMANADLDPPRALAAYAAAVEEGTRADSRLFVTLAAALRSSSWPPRLLVDCARGVPSGGGAVGGRGR